MGNRARPGARLGGSRETLGTVIAACFLFIAAPQATAETLLMLGGSDLVWVDTANPAFEIGRIPLSGLENGDVLIDLARRPLTGQVYALSRRPSDDRGRLYVVDTSTGVATAVGTEPLAIAVIHGTLISFDPVVDRLRVLSHSVNVLLDPATGAVTEAGTPVSDVVQLSEIAYSNGTPDAVSTTLYAVHLTDVVEQIGTVEPPSSGTIVPHGSGLPFGGGAFGFDISPTRNVGYALGYEGDGAVLFLYEIDLATGAATTLAEAFHAGRFVVLTRPEMLWALTTNNTLVRFSTSNPGTILSTVNVTGLQPAEELLAIDFRHWDGQLYGLGSSGRLYTIDTASGSATPVGDGSFAVPLDGTEFGLDFERPLGVFPEQDSVRISSDLGQNLVVDANTGQVVDGDRDTDGVQPNNDFRYGDTTNVPGLAYTSRLPTTERNPQPRLFALSSLLQALHPRFDKVCDVPSPFTGELPIACASGIVGLFPDDAPNAVGFDASPQTADAYLAFSDEEGAARLYTLSLSREPGIAILGAIGTDLTIRGLAVEQPGRPEVDVVQPPVTENAGEATITVNRVGGSGGPLTVRFDAFAGRPDSAAHPRIDFTPVSGHLLFADGETSKTFTVPILDDTDAEADETLRFTVRIPGDFASRMIPLTILDDDRVPGSPEIVITTPEAPTPFWSRGDISLAGTANDDVDVVQVTWADSHGNRGVASGTTNWNIPLVPLRGGDNIIVVTAVDADGNRATASVMVNVDTISYTLAEGATGAFFTTELLLANPNAVPAPVEVTFLKTDGSTIVQTLTLPEMSRQTILVNDIPGLETAEFSVTLDSLDVLPLLVERTMRWDRTGYGAHTERAAPTSLQWDFAEGAQGFRFFDTFFLLANSSVSANEATVQFLREGAPPITKTYTMNPMSRTTIYAGDIPELVDQIFGMTVRFEQPAIAERSMYFGTQPFSGGHNGTGVLVPSTTWWHAEGATGTFFVTFVLVSNPNDQEANVMLRFLPASGTPVVRTRTIPPHGRLTVDIGSEDASLAHIAVATEITSDVPVVSERAMYWPGNPTTWYEGHASAGVQSPSTKWGFAEGRVGGSPRYETFLLLANPGETQAHVTVRFLPTTGAPLERTYIVEPSSRVTAWIANDVPELAHQEFGAVISSDAPVVVERAMYWDVNGVTWASGTNAAAAPLP